MGKVYIDLRVEAFEEDLGDFLMLLAKMNYAGRIGASRSITTHIDGDGSGYIGVKRLNDKKPIHEWVNLDEEKLKKVSDGEDFEDHYIGE